MERGSARTGLLPDFDFVIAGGGPAGAIAGMSLARSGWRVAVFEATGFDQERPGETLPPEINPLLRELGLWSHFQSLSPIECPGVISAWAGQPRETDFLFHPLGPGWHIDRRRFDRMLFHAAESEGALTFPRQRADFSRGGAGWRVRGSSGLTIQARFAIDATGRNGYRIDGSRERIVDDLLLATIVRISFAGTVTRDLRTLIEAIPSGWWYSACLPRNQMIAMFFTARELYRRSGGFVREQLDLAPLTRARIGQEQILATHTAVVPVSSSCRARIAGDGWLAAGDSASSFDPLSGRGIFKALKQGADAARAADACLRGDGAALDRYADAVRREFDSYLAQKKLFYGDPVMWREYPFWKARAAA